ncbi:glutaminyl cyclase [Capsaspora owczarzaki ATCC 30864]|uniref:Glutaminyl cyclase n=1 Tax=Capsaspora owczarzaki (strain ATCC 30864) TaxID=595528 RepID=A0A0D2UTH3_CAPO3|nr:glutaminyl cyclase [Capsaspora owczarzaki ATCC 30864]
MARWTRLAVLGLLALVLVLVGVAVAERDDIAQPPLEQQQQQQQQQQRSNHNHKHESLRTGRRLLTLDDADDEDQFGSDDDDDDGDDHDGGRHHDGDGHAGAAGRYKKPRPRGSLKVKRAPLTLSTAQVKELSKQIDIGHLWTDLLQPLLIERVPGTPTHQQAAKHIEDTLTALPGWRVTTDTFNDSTPLGVRPFKNIVATLERPGATRRFVLAAHYDSKYFAPPVKFIGATDSAAPCAIMLHLAELISKERVECSASTGDATLQLVFFDGEEAFQTWTATDSIYGSRHLAALWEANDKSESPSPSQLHSTLCGIDTLMLLDLLGAKNPTIRGSFDNTLAIHDSVADIGGDGVPSR